ncbi:hypothetical protein BKA10_002929 [Microbacterium invictum]|uniref:Uncharacterized protein n=1 Tax=Microbacterium invictum TaxID=515415 RepID=A0AA40SRY1_9MICO|nr:hypothetical protein [Microbacterium invictum]
MRRGWWRRNAAALAALVVLVPVTVLVVGGNEWREYYGFRASMPVEVASGERTTYAGAEFGGADIAPLTAEGLEVPEGARAFLVTVEVAPTTTTPPSCLPLSLHEQGGAQREWSVDASLRWYDRDRPSGCDSLATGPYTIATPFLVPDDATGPFFVDLFVVGEAPRFLRVHLD